MSFDKLKSKMREIFPKSASGCRNFEISKDYILWIFFMDKITTKVIFYKRVPEIGYGQRWAIVSLEEVINDVDNPTMEKMIYNMDLFV